MRVDQLLVGVAGEVDVAVPVVEALEVTAITVVSPGTCLVTAQRRDQTRARLAHPTAQAAIAHATSVVRRVTSRESALSARPVVAVDARDRTTGSATTVVALDICQETALRAEVVAMVEVRSATNVGARIIFNVTVQRTPGGPEETPVHVATTVTRSDTSPEIVPLRSSRLKDQACLNQGAERAKAWT